MANQVLQFESLIEKKEIDLVCEIEEDLFNLKYMEYNIGYGSLYYRHGFLKTLRRVIKNLEKNKEGKQ